MKEIKTDSITLTATMRAPGGLFREPQVKKVERRVLDSHTLVETLRVIQDASKDENTKKNLQILLDQINRARLDV